MHRFFLSLLVLVVARKTTAPVAAAAAAAAFESRDLQTDEARRQARLQKIEENLKTIKQSFTDGDREQTKEFQNYSEARTENVRQKKRKVIKMMTSLDSYFALVQNGCGDAQGSSTGNDCQSLRGNYNKEVEKELATAAAELIEESQTLAEDYLPSFQKILQQVKTRLSGLNEIRKNIDDSLENPLYRDHQDFFDIEIRAINRLLKHGWNVEGRVKWMIAKLHSVIFGTMCFDFIGATGKIQSEQDYKVFQQKAKEAVEVALASEGVDGDVVRVALVKQDFHENGNNRLLKEEANNNPAIKYGVRRRRVEGQKENRELSWQGIRASILRVGTLVGIRCNCEVFEPPHDAFARRLNEGDSHHLAGGDDVISSEESSSLSDEFDDPESIEEEFEEFRSNSESSQDELLDESSFDWDVDSRDTINPLFSNGTDFGEMGIDLFGARRLNGNSESLRGRFLRALIEALNSGVLSDVVEVKVISCTGFLPQDVLGFNGMYGE